MEPQTKAEIADFLTVYIIFFRSKFSGLTYSYCNVSSENLLCLKMWISVLKASVVETFQDSDFDGS